MNDLDSKLAQVLKHNGYSLTTPRRAVFQYLVNKEPITVGSINKALSTTIDRASVYRTIDLFITLGIITRHNIGWKYKVELSDMFATHHHHFTCLNCGKIIALNESGLESFIETLVNQQNFTAVDHQIEIQGYCQDCKQVNQ